MPQVRINGQDYIVVLVADPATGLPVNPAGSSTYALTKPVAVPIGTVATLVLAANPNRKIVIVQVNGAADVALGTDNTVTAGTGILLAANDGGAGFAGADIVLSTTGAIYAIGRGAISSVVVTEGV